MTPETAVVQPTERITGVWLEKEGTLQVARRVPGQNRTVEETVPYTPLAWAEDPDMLGLSPRVRVKSLSGDGEFAHLLQFEDAAEFAAFRAEHRSNPTVDIPRDPVSLAFLGTGLRMGRGLGWHDLVRCQLDIETASSRAGQFSDADLPEDFILAIGLRVNGVDTLLELREPSASAEKELLTEFAAFLREQDPDTLEGHNLYRFDLAYLRKRCQRYRLPCNWGRFGLNARFRSSRLKVAERWIDFPRCDCPGRTVVDTYLLVQLYDLTNRELEGYGLKTVARHFGVTPSDGKGRTYLPGDQIAAQFTADREKFRAYLRDDLRETAGVADQLFPTYFAQAEYFPMSWQEIMLRGTSMKIDLLLTDRYFRGDHALPSGGGEVAPFEGGYTTSPGEGVYQKVLHYDVASLYPGLMLSIGRAPAPDTAGLFLPVLRELRTYRLEYKEKARRESDPRRQQEYQARQAAFKIIINSFYGYLGFAGARFGDPSLAAEITARGRELLQRMIELFPQFGATVLEADTDGIYVSAGEYWDNPEALREKVSAELPGDLALEFDGAYQSMFCYKAKNYALYDGAKVLIRGSALRSRGMEPFLQGLTRQLIDYLLGVSPDSPETILPGLSDRIEAGDFPLAQLAKSENLTQSPEAYQKALEGAGRKPRRASLEAAGKMKKACRAGDRVTYYIREKDKASQPDWPFAEAIEEGREEYPPYDRGTYLKKLREWEKRYRPFWAS